MVLKKHLPTNWETGMVTTYQPAQELQRKKTPRKLEFCMVPLVLRLKLQVTDTGTVCSKIFLRTLTSY